MEIKIEQLRKNFGEKVAVDIDTYTIHSGDMLGLVGNNGAGKTTLFRLMLDLLKADNGNVHVGENNVCENEDWKAHTGAFIDDGFLIDYLTPEEYFHFVGKMYGMKKEEVDERVAQFERFMNGDISVPNISDKVCLAFKVFSLNTSGDTSIGAICSKLCRASL